MNTLKKLSRARVELELDEFSIELSLSLQIRAQSSRARARAWEFWVEFKFDHIDTRLDSTRLHPYLYLYWPMWSSGLLVPLYDLIVGKTNLEDMVVWQIDSMNNESMKLWGWFIFGGAGTLGIRLIIASPRVLWFNSLIESECSLLEVRCVVIHAAIRNRVVGW